MDLELVEQPSLWVYLFHYPVSGAILGVLLGATVRERRVAAACATAGCSLFVGPFGTVLIAGSGNYFLLVLIPPVLAASGFLALGTLVVVTTDEHRRELTAWTLGGWSASLLVALAVASLAPEWVTSLDPMVPGAESLAKMSLDVGSLTGLFGFYAFYAPLTVPVAAAGYGAGLRALGVGQVEQ